MSVSDPANTSYSLLWSEIGILDPSKGLRCITEIILPRVYALLGQQKKQSLRRQAKLD